MSSLDVFVSSTGNFVTSKRVFVSSIRVYPKSFHFNCNFVRYFVSLTEEILQELKNSAKELTLIPSTDGVFEITFNNQLIFSKKELNRFPNDGEIIDNIRSRAAK